MWKWLIGLFIGWLVLFNVGCQLPGSKLEAAMSEAGQKIAQKIEDEGLLKDWLVNGDLHVNNPGLESYVAVTVAAGVRAVGVNGNIVAAVNGDATRLPADMRASLIKQLDGPISDAQRTAILEILGWNRTNPTGGGG